MLEGLRKAISTPVSKKGKKEKDSDQKISKTECSHTHESICININKYKQFIKSVTLPIRP